MGTAVSTEVRNENLSICFAALNYFEYTVCNDLNLDINYMQKHKQQIEIIGNDINIINTSIIQTVDANFVSNVNDQIMQLMNSTNDVASRQNIADTVINAAEQAAGFIDVRYKENDVYKDYSQQIINTEVQNIKNTLNKVINDTSDTEQTFKIIGDNILTEDSLFEQRISDDVATDIANDCGLEIKTDNNIDNQNDVNRNDVDEHKERSFIDTIGDSVGNILTWMVPILIIAGIVIVIVVIVYYTSGNKKKGPIPQEIAMTNPQLMVANEVLKGNGQEDNVQNIIKGLGDSEKIKYSGAILNIVSSVLVIIVCIIIIIFIFYQFIKWTKSNKIK